MHGLAAGFRLELRVVRANPDALIPLFTAPLFAIIFLAIFRQSGRPDLEPDALMAPVLMSLWWIALLEAGTMITGDRWQAVLEPLIAAPTNLASVLLGRIACLMCGFPFYVLGGVLVPVAFLPGWLQPVSSVIFLSWSSDLLRSSLKEPDVDDFWVRLAVVVMLGAISFAIGRALLTHVLRRMRVNGELATA